MVFFDRCPNKRTDLSAARLRFYVIGFIIIIFIQPPSFIQLSKGCCTNGISVKDWAGIHVVSAA